MALSVVVWFRTSTVNPSLGARPVRIKVTARSAQPLPPHPPFMHIDVMRTIKVIVSKCSLSTGYLNSMRRSPCKSSSWNNISHALLLEISRNLTASAIPIDRSGNAGRHWLHTCTACSDHVASCFMALPSTSHPRTRFEIVSDSAAKNVLLHIDSLRSTSFSVHVKLHEVLSSFLRLHSRINMAIDLKVALAISCHVSANLLEIRPESWKALLGPCLHFYLFRTSGCCVVDRSYSGEC